MESNVIYVVGIGPGAEEMMTVQAQTVLDHVDTIVGYQVYLDLLGARYQHKELISTPMKQETRRCEICFEEAEKGKEAQEEKRKRKVKNESEEFPIVDGIIKME